MKKILVFVSTIAIGACAYAESKIEPVATSFEFRAENAKGAQFRSQTENLVLMVKTRRFSDAEIRANELQKTYEAEFDTQLKQYTFQSQAEFEEFKTISSERFEWIDWGYKECLQMQAFIKSEKRDFLSALETLRSIEKLAPVSAGTALETAYVLNQLGKFDEGLSEYRKGYNLTTQYGSQQPFRAAALRGIGSTLIELKQLDEAERAFRESLEVEPRNRIAMNELKYIQSLRSK